jgi:hypothetical protein
VIGIIDNGQSNSTTMFQELAKLLQERYRTAGVLFKTKPTHMQAAPDGIVHLSTRPQDIMVVVLGGKHRHSVFLPMWTGRNTLSVIKAIH